MVERKTWIPGRDQLSHGSGTGIGAGTSGLVLELLCLPRVAQGSGQGVPPSPGVRGLPFSGAGADTGSPLKFPPSLPMGRRAGHGCDGLWELLLHPLQGH